MSQKYWGTPLRSFLEALLDGDKFADNIEKINLYRENFLADLCLENASSQVKRVATKFAQIAATGYFACENGILPWDSDEMKKACKEWFEIWLKERGSMGDLEIDKAVKNILKYIEENGDANFVDKEHGFGLSYPNVGYKNTTKKETQYLFIPSRIKEIANYRNLNQLMTELQNRKLLVLNRENKPLETISVRQNGVAKTRRVIGVSIKDVEDPGMAYSKDSPYFDSSNDIAMDNIF